MRRRTFLGVIAAWPAAAGAQATLHRIGFLSLEQGEDPSLLAKALGRLGYVEGKDFSILFRSAGGDPARLAALAGELVEAKPDLLVAGWGTLAPKALKAATTTVPIVFSTVGDPVGAGLVQSLARPGGNLTGLSGLATDLKSKQLQLLLLIVPGQKVVGALMNPDTPYTALAFKELKASADRLGVRFVPLEMRKPEDFTAARLEALVASGATSLFILEDPLTSSLKGAIVAEAIRRKLPTMCGLEDFAQAGALVTYGSSLSERHGQVARYIDRIWKGARPADLPVEQPTKFQLVINQKTARTIGVVVPSSVLATADEVIE
jgi:putative tryptophan/tyrosine transport system substrate-binding protein